MQHPAEHPGTIRPNSHAWVGYIGGLYCLLIIHKLVLPAHAINQVKVLKWERPVGVSKVMGHEMSTPISKL